MPNNLYLYRLQFGESSNSFPLTIGWTRDERDSALVPNAGSYKRVNVDWTAFGNTRYLRTNLQYQHYWPITRQYTFAVNAEMGYGKGSGRPAYPVFKNFYGGGLGTVRVSTRARSGRPTSPALTWAATAGSTSTASSTFPFQAPATTARCACSASSTWATCGANPRR